MTYPESYELEISIQLNRVIKDGPYNRQTGERMGFNSKYIVPAGGFSDIARILGEFEALADSLKPKPTEE
jgi:hypothetical protein